MPIQYMKLATVGFVKLIGVLATGAVRLSSFDKMNYVL